MSNKVNWFITDQNVTVNYQGQTHIVKRSDALADDLISAIKEGRLTDIPGLVSVAAALQNSSKGNVVVKDGDVLVRGVKVPAELARKIQSFIKEGLPYQPLMKFAEKLLENPSHRAVNELFQFLEKNDHPLTETGNFIAYKRVRGDFKDIYSGTIDNTPGLPPVRVPRNQVDEDSSRTCSNGLHVANWDYAHTKYGLRATFSTDIMLEVEVNPAHVVAIPTDYDQSKMRVCEYNVLGVVTTPYTGSSLRVVNPNYTNDEDCGEECVNCTHEGCEGCNGDDIAYCEECGEPCEDQCNEYCYQCEDEYNETEESEDRYPWEEEVENDEVEK